MRNQWFDPRKIEIMQPGSNDILGKNSARGRAWLESLRQQGRTVPEYPVAWTAEDFCLVIRVCEYLRDRLPEKAFRLETIPGMQIFPEEDCLAIGSYSVAPGAYYVIRPGPTGLYITGYLSDWEEEGSGSGAFHQFEGALKSIVFDWFLSIGDVLNHAVTALETPPRDVEMEPYDWRIHKDLYTENQRRYVEEQACSNLDSIGKARSVDNVLRMINQNSALYRSLSYGDAWYIGVDSPYFRNLSHMLNTDIFTFMDRVVVAIAEHDGEKGPMDVFEPWLRYLSQ